MQINTASYHLLPPGHPPLSTTNLIYEPKPNTDPSSKTLRALDAFLLTSLSGRLPDIRRRNRNGHAIIPSLRAEVPLFYNEASKIRTQIWFHFIELESDARYLIHDAKRIDWQLSQRLAERARYRILQAATRRFRHIAHTAGNNTAQGTAVDTNPSGAEHVG